MAAEGVALERMSKPLRGPSGGVPKRPQTAAGTAPVAQLSLFAEEAEPGARGSRRNMWRFYRIEVWPSLLGGALLMRQWGRIGTEGHRRLDFYPDTGAALKPLRRSCGPSGDGGMWIAPEAEDRQKLQASALSADGTSPCASNKKTSRGMAT